MGTWTLRDKLSEVAGHRKRGARVDRDGHAKQDRIPLADQGFLLEVGVAVDLIRVLYRILFANCIDSI